MKVLLSAGMVQGGRSGVGRYVTRIAEGLGGDGIELSVAGLAADRHLFPTVDDAGWLEIPESATGGAKNLLWHQRALPGELKRRQIDLVHIPSYRRILWRSPVRQITTIHDCAPFVLREKYGALRGIFGRWLTPLVARRCEKVIAVSEVTSGHIQRFLKVPPEKVRVVWNGIDHDFFHPAEEGALVEFRKREKLVRPYFLYVSRLEHPGKNHVRLIEGYERFRKSRELAESMKLEEEPELVFVGADWEGGEVVRERVAQSPYKSDIRLRGFADDGDLPLWYSGAAGMVMPSLFEGFGLPVVEALACGCPVAASDLDVFREVAEETADYFDPENADTIAAALQKLIELKEEEMERRKRGGIMRAKLFSWSRAISRIREIYQGG